MGESMKRARPGTSLSGRLILGGISYGLLLGGCAHRDVVDTAVNTWHGFEGGEIARLRAPAPGQDAAYPHVGRTPTTQVDMPSSEARLDLTMQLQSDRNLAQRESASYGPLPTVPPPPPKPVQSAPNAPASAVNPAGAAQAGPESEQASSVITSPAPPAPPPAAVKGDAPAAESALPKVDRVAIPPTPEGQFPQIGPNPPLPPQFPGFDIPWDANTAGPVRPDIDTSEPEGTLIRFQPSSDQVAGNPDSDYQRILSQRRHRRLTILGFGSAMSADTGLSADDQSREIALGLLRARIVAQALIARGVPASDITLKAEAVGDGVRVQPQG